MGRVAGRTALTAATFCVFLTLESVVFLAAVFFGAGLGVARLVFVASLGVAAFLAGLAFGAGFLEAVLVAVALLALTLEAGLALTLRFAVFADARLAAERAVDRRKPFVRLLLICV